MRVGVVRVDPRARHEVRDGFLVASQRNSRHPARIVVIGVVRLKFDSRGVVADGVLVKPQVPSHHAPGVIRHRIFGVGDYRPRVIRDGLVQVTAVAIGQTAVVIRGGELVVDLQRVVEIVYGRVQLARPQGQLSPRGVVKFSR